MILSPDLFPVFVFQSNEYPCFTCGKVKNVFDDTLRDLTDIESSLKNITEFRQKTQLPEHDHLMLFTKYLYWKSLPVFYLSHRREFVYSIEKPVIVVIKDTCKFRIYLENVHFCVLSSVAWICTTVPAKTTTKQMLQVTWAIVNQQVIVISVFWTFLNIEKKNSY